MARNGFAFQIAELRDVDFVRDVFFGLAHWVAVIGWFVWVELFTFRCKLHEALPMVAVHGHFVHVGDVRNFCSAMTNCMYFQVIGVAVVAVPVVCGEHIDVFFNEYEGKFLCGGFGVGVNECVRGFVLFPAVHAAVVVTQPHQTVHAKNRT